MKKHTMLLAIGFINIIHGLTHLLQFVQSALLFSYAMGHNENNWVHKLLENPIMGLIWAIIGIITMYLGYKDYKHHKEHKNCHSHK